MDACFNQVSCVQILQQANRTEIQIENWLHTLNVTWGTYDKIECNFVAEVGVVLTLKAALWPLALIMTPLEAFWIGHNRLETSLCVIAVTGVWIECHPSCLEYSPCRRATAATKYNKDRKEANREWYPRASCHRSGAPERKRHGLLFGRVWQK